MEIEPAYAIFPPRIDDILKPKQKYPKPDDDIDCPDPPREPEDLLVRPDTDKPIKLND